MASVINLAPKGAIKQGGMFAQLDFSTATSTSIWSFYLMVISATPYLFVRHSSDASPTLFRPGGTDLTVAFSDSELGSIKNIVREASKAPAVYTSLGVTYTPDTQKDVYYTDGAGNFRSTPYTEATTQDQIKNLLSQVTSSTDTPDTNTKKWYQKPVNWLIGGLVLAGGTGLVIYLKKKFSN